MEALTAIASNKMFVGLTMIMMNLGSRFIIGDLTKVQNGLLASDIAKKAIVFCMFFVPTRDIVVAVMLTFAFFFVIHGILDEKQAYSLLKTEGYESEEDAQTQRDNYIKLIQHRTMRQSKNLQDI